MQGDGTARVLQPCSCTPQVFRYPSHLYLKKQNPLLLPCKPGLCSYTETTPWAGPASAVSSCPTAPWPGITIPALQLLQPPPAVISTCVMTPQTHQATSLSPKFSHFVNGSVVLDTRPLFGTEGASVPSRCDPKGLQEDLSGLQLIATANEVSAHLSQPCDG